MFKRREPLSRGKKPCRSIYVFDLNRLFINEFDSKVEAANYVGVEHKLISNLIKYENPVNGYILSFNRHEKLDTRIF
ncbi:MAG: hypothetical protein IT212_07715 [Bacteroidia bacterium]|nr:hypothetical protein [Bacteroidia bacterium]